MRARVKQKLKFEVVMMKRKVALGKSHLIGLGWWTGILCLILRDSPVHCGDPFGAFSGMFIVHVVNLDV